MAPVQLHNSNGTECHFAGVVLNQSTMEMVIGRIDEDRLIMR
jgi:hypothetical protein